MSAVDEHIRAARQELEALQSSDHPIRVEQKRLDYLEALGRERVGVAAQHAAALRRGNAREKIPSPFVRGELLESELTGFEPHTGSSVSFKTLTRKSLASQSSGSDSFGRFPGFMVPPHARLGRLHSAAGCGRPQRAGPHTQETPRLQRCRLLGFQRCRLLG
jgi:hypothetical protein